MKKHDSAIPRISRRQFLQGAAAGLAFGVGGATAVHAGRHADKQDRYWRFAVISDTHIIDEFYTGPEGSPLDTQTVFQSTDRLLAARETVNAIDPVIDRIFVPGDFIHNYPSHEWEFYFQNRTRIDNAKEIIDGFRMPVHVGFGNHDYDIGDGLSREFTHDLFREKIGIEPYYAVDDRGWKFLHINNFLGETMNEQGDGFNKSIGSFGETQLQWLEAQLQQGRPTFIFLHFPPATCQATEVADFGLFPLMRRYRDTIKMVINGHVHIWLQFADLIGPLNYSMGSTRYNKDAYFLVELDNYLQTYRVLNWDQIRWGTYWTDPYAATKKGR
ncbi:MAG: metallophosphoesterase [Candidatus Lernaella stagnicola]|nr:metallophosphoesterase [Candidatus Lernaella stagnicola]